MRHRDFFVFVFPSALLMLLFIALPIGSVLVQSLFVEHDRVLEVVKSCTPFGCSEETRVNVAATAALKSEAPLGKFNGLGTYLNRAHLATAELAEIFADNDGLGDIVSRIYNLPFYKALSFTLVYTFTVTPLAIFFGFLVALGVNTLPRLFKGPVIFLSLLPYVVTPLIGSLILYWMINTDGIIGTALQYLSGNPDLSLKASPVLTWLVLIIYGSWHMAPFCFVVFYAGLQTLPQDTLESAMIDGASRFERVRYVVVPHLKPLATFVGLILLMDNFRVFEPIVGFSSSAHATSLSYSIFSDLNGQVDQLFGSAAATSVLTTIGVIILLMPVLVRTWRDFNRKAR